MKRTILMSSLAATLMVGSLIASAQAPPVPAQPATAQAPASHTDPSDPSKGQELTGDQKQQPASPPATEGQDKAAGNDLVAGKNDAKMQGAAEERPDFQTMDVKKKGYLTASDVSSQVWLSKNFARCDSSHDGHLTPQEYAACLK